MRSKTFLRLYPLREAALRLDVSANALRKQLERNVKRAFPRLVRKPPAEPKPGPEKPA